MASVVRGIFIVGAKRTPFGILGGPVSSTSGVYFARHALLKTGIPQDRPALHVNRLCGTGFQATVNGAQDILTGATKISLTGGVENMSQFPFIVRDVRFGTTLGASYQFEDSLWASLTDSYCKMPMASTTEKLGAQYNVTRQEVDEYSFQSRKRWKEAQDAGRFKEKIAPASIKGKKGPETVEVVTGQLHKVIRPLHIYWDTRNVERPTGK